MCRIEIDLEHCPNCSGEFKIIATILKFRHLLETHKISGPMLAIVKDALRDKGLMLRIGTAVEATLISAQSSTKIGSGHCDPEKLQ